MLSITKSNLTRSTRGKFFRLANASLRNAENVDEHGRTRGALSFWGRWSLILFLPRRKNWILPFRLLGRLKEVWLLPHQALLLQLVW